MNKINKFFSNIYLKILLFIDKIINNMENNKNNINIVGRLLKSLIFIFGAIIFICWLVYKIVSITTKTMLWFVVNILCLVLLPLNFIYWIITGKFDPFFIESYLDDKFNLFNDMYEKN